MKTFSILAILLTLAFAFGAHPANAASITVNSLTDDPSGPTGGVTTLRDAITQANTDQTGDTITFSVTGTIDLGASLPEILYPMTIQGPGASSLAIDGQESYEAFYAYIDESNENPPKLFSVSNLTIQNCTAEAGAAAYIEETDADFTNCVFSDNIATGGEGEDGGGAIYNDYYGGLTLTNCTFTGNQYTGSDLDGGGGAVYDYYGAGNYLPVGISGCTFTNNSAPNEQGGAIFSYYTGDYYTYGLVITDSMFNGNSAYGDGGAISCYAEQASITNSTFVSNAATETTNSEAGAIYNDNDLTVTNCTFFGNTATSEGGALYNDDSLTVLNCIFWNDTSYASEEDDVDYASSVTYSDVDGGATGTGNINSDPLFVRNPGTNGPTDYGNLKLTAASPCIGAGTSMGGPTTSVPSTDILGIPRPNPPSMGAYEYVAPPNVSGLVPNSVTIQSTAQKIEVYGSGFYGGTTSSAVTSVTIGGTPASIYTVVSDGLLFATVPSTITRVAGVYNVVVTTESGSSPGGAPLVQVNTRLNPHAVVASFEFTVNPNPMVTSVSPTVIPAIRDGATTITVNGSGFLAGHADTDAGLDVTATINSVQYPIVDLGTVTDGDTITDSQLTFSVPTSDLSTGGSYNTLVTVLYRSEVILPTVVASDNPDSALGSTLAVTSPASPADLLDVADQPTVTAVVPSSITQTASSQTIVVSGTGFFGGGSSPDVSDVEIGGSPATTFEALSDTVLLGTVPTSKTNTIGSYDVVVTTTGGTSVTSPADQLGVVAAPSSGGSSAGSPAANGQTVGVPFNTATAITLTGSDPNSPIEALTYTVETEPAHGTLTGTAPNLTYTPSGNYHGTDSFAFEVENTSDLSSAPATVTLSVAAGTPTANGQTTSVPFNTATAVTLAGSDPNSPAETLTYSLATLPAHGTLAGTAPALTYTPASGYSGTDSFTFTVQNTSGLIGKPAIVTLNVAGSGVPTANAQTLSIAFGAATALSLTGSDPNSPPEPLTYAIVGAPLNGTLTGTAPALVYTPNAGFSGVDSFTFTVEDTSGKTSAAAAVALNVAAGTPTATAQSVHVVRNIAAAITLAGIDPNSPAQALTFAVASGPSEGTLTGTAPNLTYTPKTGFRGTDTFTFTAQNTSGKTSLPATVTLDVAPAAPTADSQSVTIAFNTATTVTLTGTDPNIPVEALSYSITTEPANGIVTGTAPNLLYTPNTGFAGTDSFTFAVRNTSGEASAPATVTLKVQQIVHTFSAGLSMISVPSDYSNESLDTVLGYASPVLATWVPATNTYAVTPTTPANTLAIGLGYWARFPASETITTLGTAPASGVPFTIALSRGWNMIGCPQASAAGINTLSVIDSTDTAHTFADAATSGLVGDAVFTYQPGDTSYEVIPAATGSLTPYEGYWLYASAACTLSFPVSGTTPPQPPS